MQHRMSSCIPLDSSSRIKSKRTSRHKTELVLRNHELPSQSLLDHSLLKLHGVTKKLDTFIVVANLRIAFFKNRDDFTESLFFSHLCACEDLVE
ncbi:hypothetical protein Tco_0819131 [Tanacetum coccineum]|uniref:Uncharacterized protein n=1 Tax=Tanacetum coccineum TaxID=301880 RepID=A0ABQ5A895_9ASTR